MLVAIPSDDDRQIAQHTGRCRGFSVYSVDGAEYHKVEYRSYDSPHHEHTGTEHHSESCGHTGADHSGHSHEGLLGLVTDCKIFIAIGMGPRLVNDLQSHGIKILFTPERDIVKSLDALVSGQLVENLGASACHRH
jgi:predicted Fe-Mo cluster-binding NifX family protein